MKGFKIELGKTNDDSEEFVVQPIKVEDLPKALALINKLNDLDIEEKEIDETDQTKSNEILQKRVDISVDLFTLVMSRNYPNKSREDWLEIVDIGDVFGVMNRMWEGIGPTKV